MKKILLLLAFLSASIFAEEKQSENCTLDGPQYYEVTEIFNNGKIVTCAERYDLGCGWMEVGRIMSYPIRSGNVIPCPNLLGKGYAQLSVSQVVQRLKITNSKFQSIAKRPDAIVYFRDQSICVYYDDESLDFEERILHVATESPQEICLPINEAESFLTIQAKKLLE